jgi:hypothetical protein
MTTWRVDLIWVVLAIAAGVLGVWLGIAGADVSPVVTEAPVLVGGHGR